MPVKRRKVSAVLWWRELDISRDWAKRRLPTIMHVRFGISDNSREGKILP